MHSNYSTPVRGSYPNSYDTSPDNSSQAESTDHQYIPSPYQYAYQQAAQYAEAARTPDQLSHLREELFRKQTRLNQLQYEVDTTENHRREVQAHNHELQAQLAQLQQVFWLAAVQACFSTRYI